MQGMAMETHVHRHHHDHHHDHHHRSSNDHAETSAASVDKQGNSNLVVNIEDIPVETQSTAAITDDEDYEEDDASLLKAVLLQLDDIWNTVQLKAVWRPMAFVYVFNILQTPNVAWQSYLQLTLHFEPFILVVCAVNNVMYANN